MTRYLSGLCVAGLGLCGGGWLIVAAVAFGAESPAPAERVNLLTGAALVVVSGVSLLCWATAWRRRMRVDGVVTDRFQLVSRREARWNRRQLSRDVGRTARLAKRSAREARRSARRAARLAGGGVLSSGAVLGSAVGGDGPYSVAVAPAEAAESSGESAVELLSELRAMLMPLLTAAGERAPGEPTAGGPPDAPDAPAAAAAPAPALAPLPLPRRTPRPASLLSAVPPARSPADGDDPLFAADGEEAWW